MENNDSQENLKKAPRSKRKLSLAKTMVYGAALVAASGVGYVIKIGYDAKEKAESVSELQESEILKILIENGSIKDKEEVQSIRKNGEGDIDIAIDH